MGITGVSTQLMIGRTEEEYFSQEEIKLKLLKALKTTGINKLLFWNAGKEENFNFISSFCKDYGIELYCWYPVMADIMVESVSKKNSVTHLTGMKGYGKLGKWPRIGDGEENFLFYCPSNSGILDKVFKKYLTIIDNYSFDGVFLDRIRYPSFANGLESLFTCTCHECQIRQSLFSGVSVEETLNNMHILLGFFKESTVDNLKKIHSFSNLIRKFNLGNFFDFRTAEIENIIIRFISAARKRKKKIGLDLFTPTLSHIVGQDYKNLQMHSDWIKMMTYCYANGPAGIPLEASCFIKGLLELNETGLSEKEAVGFCSQLFRTDFPDNTEKILSDGVSTEYLREELFRAKKLLYHNKNEIIPGIELVNHPFFTPPVTKKKCKSYLDVLDSMNSEIIISWNILYIPDEYLNMIRERIR
jgi:hypothetical protein